MDAFLEWVLFISESKLFNKGDSSAGLYVAAGEGAGGLGILVCVIQNSIPDDERHM